MGRHEGRGKTKKLQGRGEEIVGILTGESTLELEGDRNRAEGQVEERLGKPGRRVTGVAGGCRSPVPDVSPASTAIGRVALLVALILVRVAPPALAQDPPFESASPTVVSASSATPHGQSSSQLAIDQISGCVDSGTLFLEIDLSAGRVPVADAWDVEIVGAPTAVVSATASGGRVSRLDVAVTGGRLILKGRHLRPKIRVESFHFEQGEAVGRGFSTISESRSCDTWDMVECGWAAPDEARSHTRCRSRSPARRFLLS